MPAPLPGTAPQAGQGAYGQVPTVPSPTSTQGDVISGNMGNLGGLYGLTGSLNTEIAGQAALPYQLNLPNYGAMTGQSSGNILSLLKGQVPGDVANQISQMAAERGISTGSIGSPNANTALLRSLGLTSLGLQGQGETELTGAIQRTPTGQQFNPQSFLVTPGQEQEAAYMASLFGAAPNPTLNAQEALRYGQQGLLAGSAGGVPTGGAPGNRDLLGFPITPDTGSLFGPGSVSAGATGPFSTTPPTPYSPLPFTGTTGPEGTGTDWQTGMQLPVGFQPGDLEAMGFGDTSSLPGDWQTGVQTPPGYGGFDLTSGDLFGGGG